MIQSIRNVGALLAVCVLTVCAEAADVSLTINGQPAKVGEMKPADIQSLVISNGTLQITFGKDVNGDFSGTSVIKDGKELAHNLHGIEPRDVDRGRTFYLDSGAGRNHLQVDQVKVYKNTPQMAHFAVIDNRSGQLEHHFVMMKDQSGIYGYVVIKAAPDGRTIVNGETRTMYRFDRDILDYAWCVERTGQQPKYADLVKLDPPVQDETWKLPDGTIYQKYDYCAYFSESPMWGHYGHGFGVWFMPVSTEYYAGGPLRQELIVHQDALILNYIGGGHFGHSASPAGRNGTKFDGPWFLYFNTGASPDAMISDALGVAKQEQTKWPYQWVDEGDLYPLKRTTVTGQLKIADGRSAGGAWVILAQPGGMVYKQGGDYIFNVKADNDGKFNIPNVRPGTYALRAWANQGSVTQELIKEGVEVKGDKLDLGAVAWNPPHRNHLLWQIGKSDRMASEFKFGGDLRTMMTVDQCPANLTFTIGKSKDSEDWYYAQTQVGKWNINFDLPQVPTVDAYLTVAVAGGGGGPSVSYSVNGHALDQVIAPSNDQSTYRAAHRSGVYGVWEMKFPVSYLKPGQNTVEFNMTAKGGRWNGIMYDTIILEAD